jgi:acetyltransferase-like isoleucine patch superfamily enzyme
VKLLFETKAHHLGGIFSGSADSIATDLDVLGRPLVIHNLEKLLRGPKPIERILFPEGSNGAASLVQARFPRVDVDEYDSGSPPPGDGEDSMRVPLNSMVASSSDGDFAISEIVYPWELLGAMMKLLTGEVTSTKIAGDAHVARSAVIEGPCIISQGAYVDDFCKIKGPAYLGENSRVGTGSLLRGTVLCKDASVGFGNEVGRSYVAEKVRITHHDVILDTLLGENCWLAAYVGTTNVLLNNKNVRYKIGDKVVDTGLTNFGAVISHDCSIGAGVIFLPGRYLPPGSVINPGVVYSDEQSLSQRD